MIKKFVWRLFQGGKNESSKEQADLVKCSCCDKMIPASQMELSFNLPDEIASLSIEERERRCEGTNDHQSLDGNKFFVRGLIPLPIIGKKDNYCLGVWAEISKETYATVLELWNEDCKTNENPTPGKLANSIPYTFSSISCDVQIKLQDSKTRPFFYIQDKDCSLFNEQKEGVTQHRLFDFSNHFNRDLYQLTEENELESSNCSCCDQITRVYCGAVTNHLGETEGDYWLRIPSGHSGRFTVAISISRGDEKRVAVLIGESIDGDLTYWIQDKDQSPWEDFGEYGRLCSRDEVLSDIYKSHYFDIADRIADGDSRLKVHIGRE